MLATFPYIQDDILTNEFQCIVILYSCMFQYDKSHKINYKLYKVLKMQEIVLKDSTLE